MRPTRVEIDLSRLDKNIKAIKKQLDPSTSIMAIVKANAYGHGILEVGRQAIDSGALSLGVAILEEGIELRRGGITSDILVLGEIAPDQVDLLLDDDLSVCLFTENMARLIDEKARVRDKKVKVHLKIDTGMGRIGLRGREGVFNLVESIKDMESLVLEGAFTHFACADDPHQEYSQMQLNEFSGFIQGIKERGIRLKWIHGANTAAIFNLPKSHFNLVRAGIGIYGYLPSHMSNCFNNIKPILTWSTKIAFIKTVYPGDSISYGRTYVARDLRVIATLPVGYGDGYNRGLSNKGWVLIKGRKAPIVGTICMDQMMVDITDIPNVGVGEEAILIGKQGGETISAHDLAKLRDTVSYEVLTNISMRVPRIYKKG